MYISNWDEFQKAAEEIYTASPETTRYVSGFRHVDGELILKVTDDRTIIKYKTNQASDLRKFTNLNLSLMSKMQNKPMEASNEATEVATSGPQIPKVTSAPSSAKSSPAPQSRKKKNNKRKA